MRFEPDADRPRSANLPRPKLARPIAVRTLPAIGRAAKIVGINLLLLLVLLVPLELYFGYWLAGPGAVTLFDATPGRVEVRSSPLYPPGTTITNSRNQYGFRGGPADPARIDMLVLGGSTTAERYIDDKDIWSVQLETLLHQGDCPIGVANAGLDGYSTVGHIASFNGWFDAVSGLKPRFILAYIGINDAAVSPRSAWYEDSTRYKSRWRQFEHYVAARSALRRLYGTWRGWWQARQAGLLHDEVPITLTTVWQPASLPAGFETAVAEKVQAYRLRLARLTQLIHEFGAQPIYVTQKRLDGRLVDGAWQEIPGSESARSAATLAAINRATLEFCRERGEVCVDLAEEIDFAPSEFADGVHTRPSGSAHIGRFLAGALQPVVCAAPG